MDGESEQVATSPAIIVAGRVLRVGASALLLAGIVAIWLQDRGGALPLGLFNEGRELYARLSDLCGLAILGALAVFAWEFWRRRPSRLGSILRSGLAAFLLLEVLLFALDAAGVSRGDGIALGGPYRERRSATGEWITLKKARPESPLGFRTDEPWDAPDESFRVLFLGDSYTEGSGRAPACNYPEVAAATLSERLDRPVRALNAGVAGYGPVDAARLLAHLDAEGLAFDAVVFSLFTENDFSDNLPGTERRAMAGMNFRFPRSGFLRTFHPLNSRTFRWSLFVGTTARLNRGAGGAAWREGGECQLEPEPFGEVGEELARLVRRRFATNYGGERRVAVGEVAGAVERMEALAAERGTPLVRVVFPDRVLLDPELREALDISLPGDADHLVSAGLEGSSPAIDASPALAAGAENYRGSDTHLSDLGNLRAGRYAGERLAEALGSDAAERPPRPW
jgi:lysophospholipase L1-like esterase